MNDTLIEDHVVTSEMGRYIEEGLALAEKDAFKPYFEDELAIENELLKSQTAIMMETALQWAIHEGRWATEATRSAGVSGFVDQIFPVLRTAFPNLILHELVLVQPLKNRYGQIFYMDFVVGRNKGGTFTKGQKLFDHRQGYPAITDYTSESITNDVTGALAGANATFNGQTTEMPVKPNTFIMQPTHTAGTPVNIIDDGNGALVGTNVTGTLDYETGAFSITHGTSTFDIQTFTANYYTDYEINQELPTVDVQFLATGITVEEHALRYRYSMNASFDFKQEFGGKMLDGLLMSVMSQLLSAEITYLVLSDLWNMAGAAADTFSLTVPAGTTQFDHFRSIIYRINRIGNLMYLATQRAIRPTWIVCDANAAAVLQTIPAPTFQQSTIPNGTIGAHKIGTLGGINVYLDPLLQTLPNASAIGNLLIGYRGNDFLDAPYVWAPYQLLASTPETVLDDFMYRRAMMSRFGRKRLNPALVLRLDLVA